MALVGSFGRELDDEQLEPDYFLFHGESFEVGERVSALPIMRFAWTTRGAQSQTNRADTALARAMTEDTRQHALAEKAQAELEMLSGMHVFLRDTIGVDQWDRFEALAIQYGDDIPEIMEICQAIYASVVDRPTRQPSDSSGGRSRNGSGSPAPSGFGGQTPGPTTPAAAPAQMRPDRAEIHALLAPVGDGIRSSA